MDFLTKEHEQDSLIKGISLVLEWLCVAAAKFTDVGTARRLGNGLILTESAPLAVR